MGSISHYLKDLGRGARGARAIGREQAADLFGQVLDGQVTDYEVGAFCIAMRIKGETADEMCGFLDATHARLMPIAPATRPTVVLPSYNGARKLPVLTPLLALLLAREGLPVLLHGMRTEARRVLASDVLQALGIAPAFSPDPIAPGSVAHIHAGLLCPGLARLLAVREVVGLRNPGHSVVKLMNPVRGPSLLVTAYTHPEYVEMLHATFAARGMDVLLSRGLEGEVAADPRRTPRYDAFVQGAHHVWDEQQPGTASEVPGLPAEIDVEATARYTQRVLAGELPVPAPLSRQVEHILRLAGQIPMETTP
ncbi:DNA-binding protein YbiB [Acidovorax sp. GBBC 3334]|uniref:DNA-binding protein YbiB n=1 Tax=Acidovorax sp. GBBC 3334 TaxID=2940496 RepID=UPI002303D4D2|nr:DNA-binding protein YbiB [Acidovorax sp. GBBC 3334]MDA8457167.1 DNA-binding protein YbiB [Acidovorax sp. GBBC 3334]